MRGIVIAGTHSGCGKTMITLGILAALHRKRYDVQPFKTGPDFIDTGLHTLITGRPSINLDLWMCGKDYVIQCFHKHSAGADISIIEGVMGMHDGNFSTADLAAVLGLPVILVVDAYGMAESAGAVVKGFSDFGMRNRECGRENSELRTTNPERSFAGVIFNRVASERHYKRLRNSVQSIPVLGYLPRNVDFTIPHRHLGLVVAEENPMGLKEIAKLSDAILAHVNVDLLVKQCKRVEDNKSRPIPSELPRIRPSTLKIAVAYDRAFCFYYEENLDLLKRAGAEIVTFSPLVDSEIPDDVNGLYLGGGYPELYAEQLSDNRSMLESVSSSITGGMPAYGECGGFMYLTEGIYDFGNKFHPMVGVFPFKTKMTKKRAGLGYREIAMQEDSLLGEKGSSVRGHEFHYSEIVHGGQRSVINGQEIPGPAATELLYTVKDGSGNKLKDEGYRMKNALGSYIHVHFGSNPSSANNFIKYVTHVRNSTSGREKETYGTYTSGRARQP